MLEAAGAPSSLRSIGVKREDLPELARRALKDVCIVTSPRQADEQKEYQHHDGCRDIIKFNVLS
jgi:alcohol dehydrogenase class IV